MFIAETFSSLQGEGTLAGVPSFFIRTSGCNLRCRWCDTPYTSWLPEGERRPLEGLVAEEFGAEAGRVHRGEEDLDAPGELWDALDYSPSFPAESATTIRVKSKDDGRPIGFWRTLGWVGVVFVVVAGCLWLLASLPPLE